jgi:hypothetical protein
MGIKMQHAVICRILYSVLWAVSYPLCISHHSHLEALAGPVPGMGEHEAAMQMVGLSWSSVLDLLGMTTIYGPEVHMHCLCWYHTLEDVTHMACLDAVRYGLQGLIIIIMACLDFWLPAERNTADRHTIQFGKPYCWEPEALMCILHSHHGCRSQAPVNTPHAQHPWQETRSLLPSDPCMEVGSLRGGAQHMYMPLPPYGMHANHIWQYHHSWLSGACNS